jgi:hypothetical protein
MVPTVPRALLAQADDWANLHRWERSELGKALRRRGLSYGEIRELVPVPKGTLSGWCRDIRLSDQQVAAIKRRTIGRRGVPRDTQRKRRAQVASIERSAVVEAMYLIGDPRWVAGTSLYWGEGAKTKRTLAVTNSDPGILRCFVGWVRAYHDQEAEFVLALHLHEGNDELKARQYWADVLDLREVVFHKTFIKPRGTGHRKNSLRHGVCRVVMRRSTDAWIRTMAWIRVLAEEFV